MTRALLFLFSLSAFAQTSLAIVSAATYARDAALAPGMIATGFASAVTGTGLTVAVRDSSGTDRTAEVVAIAPGQISFVVPAAVAQGHATATVSRQGTALTSGTIRVALVAPGLFTANASGAGAPAGFVLQIAADGTRAQANLFEPFPGQTTYEARAFDAAKTGTETYLLLFGTGIRNAALSSFSARIGDTPVPVLAAQVQSEFPGLDQINLGPLPPVLAGRRGLAELQITVDGIAANTVTLAPTAPSSADWGRRADLLEANSEMAVTGLDNKIYVLGGYPSSRVTVASVQVYDTLTDTWSLTTPLPTAVNHAIPAAWNGKLYLIGGQTDANTAYVNLVQEYDPAIRAWRTRAPMPTARSAGAAAVIDGKIYVAGGRPPRGADFAVYDPAKNEWTALPDLPTQRNHLAAAAANGKVYVFGGRFEGGFQSEQTDTIEIFDPQSNTWTKGASMPKPRGGLNAVGAYGCIHVFGGEFTTGVHPDHDVYNPVANTWISLPAMPVPVHGVTGAVFQDGLIYLAGGGIMQGGSSGTRLHQVYRPNQVCR